MKYGCRFLLLLCVLSCLCLVAGAVDVLPDDTTVPDLEPTVPKVALDDETLRSVTVPIFVPVYATLAPMIGSPFSSVTLPFIRFRLGVAALAAFN